MTELRLDRIECTEFRGFARMAMDLHPEFTLIVGANGAGKTSALDAMAIGLANWGAVLRRQIVPAVLDHAHRRILRSVRGKLTHWKVDPPRIELRGTRDGTVIDIVVEFDRGDIGETKRDILVNRVDGEDLPVIMYYGISRADTALVHSDDEDALSRLEGYAGCLDPATKVSRLEQWMQWRETIRLQELAASIQHGDTPVVLSSPELDAVERAVCECVPEAKSFRYDYLGTQMHFCFEGGRVLPFRNLSDGYRSFVSLVADLARRCIVLNPHHSGDAPKLTTGVVLIDEIDLHLHPAWQRQVIGNLRRAFPRIQFIATTHSPQVVSSAKREWVRLLDVDGTVQTVGFVEGRDSNSILEDIFGDAERPAETVARLTELFVAIDSGDHATAWKMIADLQSHLGPDDGDLVRARWMLDQEDPAA